MLSKIVLFFIAVTSLHLLKAQDTTYNSGTGGITVTEEQWYMQPWAWIAGGVLLLILLIALFSGGRKNKNTSKTDRVIITKTVRTETDVDN